MPDLNIMAGAALTMCGVGLAILPGSKHKKEIVAEEEAAE